MQEVRKEVFTHNDHRGAREEEDTLSQVREPQGGTALFRILPGDLEEELNGKEKRNG